MFRFVHVWHAGDVWDPALAAEGFVGIECDGDECDGDFPKGVARVGRRGNVDRDHGHRNASTGNGYVVHPPIVPPAYGAAVGRALHDRAESRPDTPVLIENGGAFTTALDLWTVLEAAHHRHVKVAIDVDTAAACGQTAAVLVPTLNLRIGQLRVHGPGEALADYARRLAGIGFDGLIVLNPTGGLDRVAASRQLAGLFRAVLPVAATKKSPPAKTVKSATTP